MKRKPAPRLPDDNADITDAVWIVAVDVGTIPMATEDAEAMLGGLRVRWSNLGDIEDRATDKKTDMVFTHPAQILEMIEDLQEIYPELHMPEEANSNG